MIDRKRKKNTLPYVELISKMLKYSGYDFGGEEPIYVHTETGQAIIRKMGYAIQEGEFIPYQLR